MPIFGLGPMKTKAFVIICNHFSWEANFDDFQNEKKAKNGRKCENWLGARRLVKYFYILR